MTKEKLYELIKLNASNNTSNIEVQDDVKLIDDLGYDSVDLIQLVVDIEETFGAELINDNLVLDKLNTPAKLWEMVSDAMEVTAIEQ